jgi:ribosomal protein S18 acetylase RimI-like enzyme
VLNLNETLPRRDRFSPRELRALVDEKRVRVAYLDVTPCGFFILRGNRLLAVMVAPQFRRNGCGFALVCEAVNAGARRCEVRAGNFASEHMFRKAGFRVEAIKPGVYADGEAALKMRIL